VTLIERSETGERANALGNSFHVGLNDDDERIRALLGFDISDLVPEGSTVTSVELTLYCDRTQVNASTVSLHEVQQDWGVGTSDAGNNGDGTSATLDDATWLHTFYNTSFWNNPGGDFDAAASASLSVTGCKDAPGFHTWGSTPEMVADVQGWLDDPGSDFGWAVVGDETQRSARRFASSENSTEEFWPTLAVTVPEPTAALLQLAALGILTTLARRRRKR
jgi:hypothetical protein